MMQVHGPGADLDTLCIGPSYVNREVDMLPHKFWLCASLKLFSIFTSDLSYFYQEDFFYTFHDILASMDEVTELQPVPDAHVPVMKFKFDGISIDLLYASISCLIVPEVSDIFLFFYLYLYQNNHLDEKGQPYFALVTSVTSNLRFGIWVVL